MPVYAQDGALATMPRSPSATQWHNATAAANGRPKGLRGFEIVAGCRSVAPSCQI